MAEYGPDIEIIKKIIMKIMMKMTLMKSLETWSMVTTPAAAKLSEYLGSGSLRVCSRDSK